jgi:hypothetical protein
MVRSDIAVSALRSSTKTHAFTSLNAYNRNICVLLYTIVLILHIIIDKRPLLFWIYTAISLCLTLPGILKHLIQFAVNRRPRSSRSVLTLSAIALKFSRPLRDHPLPLSLSVFLSYWRQTLEKVYCGNLVKANVLC